MDNYHPVGRSYQVSAPYPPVQAEGKNRKIGQAMLANIGGTNSEMSAVTLYFYDNLLTKSMPEVAETFHRVSIVEMHHLEIFGTLAKQCGEDPRLWSDQRGKRRWWTPGYLQYEYHLGALIQAAIREERVTIQRYQRQMGWISDANVVANLARVIEDEERHIEIFHEMYHKYVTSSDLPPSL